MARVPPKRKGCSTPGLFGEKEYLYALTEAGKRINSKSWDCLVPMKADTILVEKMSSQVKN